MSEHHATNRTYKRMIVFLYGGNYAIRKQDAQRQYVVIGTLALLFV